MERHLPESVVAQALWAATMICPLVRLQQPGLAPVVAIVLAAITACVSHTASVWADPVFARCLAVSRSIGLAQCPCFRYRPCTLGFHPWHRLSPWARHLPIRETSVQDVPWSNCTTFGTSLSTGECWPLPFSWCWYLWEASHSGLGFSSMHQHGFTFLSWVSSSCARCSSPWNGAFHCALHEDQSRRFHSCWLLRARRFCATSWCLSSAFCNH